MRQAIEFIFRDGSKRLGVIQGTTQREIVERAEKAAAKMGAVNFFLRGSEYDPRRRTNKQTYSRSIVSRVLRRRVSTRRTHDPRVFRFGVGNLQQGGKPHGYLGRHVLDLGDRHAHAIVDIPWNALKVGVAKLKARFDPWRYALKGSRARLLAVRNPRPTGTGDRAIIEAALHVPTRQYKALRASGEFDVLSDGVLARRGRKKKATNIFVMPP